MKIRVEHGALANAIVWVVRNLPSRPAAPILARLLMNASGDKVTLSSLDSIASAQVTMSTEITDEGTMLASGQLPNKIARSLLNKSVEIVSDHTQVELICGSTRLSLQTLPVEECSTLPRMSTQIGFVDTSVSRRFVNQIVIAADYDGLLSVLTGMRVGINGNRLSLLTTDRYRVTLKELAWQPSSPDVEGAVLVPGRVLADTAKSLTSGKTVMVPLPIAESGNEGLVGFTGERAKSRRDVTTRLLSQVLPKVRHLMDIVGTITVRIPATDLLVAVKRVSLVVKRNTPLHTLIEDDHTSLEAAIDDQAHTSEAIEAQVGMVGEEKPIEAAGFNPHYLLNTLGTLDALYVHFSFTAPGKPCLITGPATIDGDQLLDYRHVIMLMRLPS